MTSDIFRSLDKTRVSLLCSFDLSSAFDCVNHETLLKRLRLSFGLEATVLKWFQSFLSDRLQCISFGDSFSNYRSVSCGVPQGSVLGPLLFVMYVSDLFPVVDAFHLQAHMFADDLMIYGFCGLSSTSNLIAQMSACVGDIYSWCNSNSLQLNAEKSQCMWCSSKPLSRSLPCEDIHFDNFSVPLVSSMKYLGVHLDCDLSFSTHVTKTVSSCFGILRQIRSIRRCVNASVLRSLITALVLTRVDYCLPILSGVQDLKIKRLQSILHAAARLIFCRGRFSSVTPLLQQLRWLPIKARIDFRLLLLVHRCLHGAAPRYLSNDLVPVSSLPSRSRLRSSTSHDLCAPSVRRPTLGGRAFTAVAARTWNALPASLQSEPSGPLFKRHVLNYLLDKAY